MVLVSQAPFKLNLGEETLTPEKNELAKGEDCYLLRVVVGDAKAFTLEGAVGVAALSVLPSFMNVDSY